MLQHKYSSVDAPNSDPRCCENEQKINFFLRGDLRPLPNKKFQFGDHFFSALFHKDSENLKTLDIRLQEVGENRPQNIHAKRGQIDKQTNRHTDTQTIRRLDRIGPVGRFDEKGTSSSVLLWLVWVYI